MGGLRRVRRRMGKQPTHEKRSRRARTRQKGKRFVLHLVSTTHALLYTVILVFKRNNVNKNKLKRYTASCALPSTHAENMYVLETMELLYCTSQNSSSSMYNTVSSHFRYATTPGVVEARLHVSGVGVNQIAIVIKVSARGEKTARERLRVYVCK